MPERGARTEVVLCALCQVQFSLSRTSQGGQHETAEVRAVRDAARQRGDPRVTEETRQHVRQMMRELELDPDSDLLTFNWQPMCDHSFFERLHFYILAREAAVRRGEVIRG